MTRVLMFKVEIEGLEDKIWRNIEITDIRTVAELAYTILASFHSLAYHLYDIKYNNEKYDSMVCFEDYHGDEELIDATKTKLNQLNLQNSDTLIMTYDYGTTTTFVITYLKSREFEKGNGNHYPYIVSGQGYGMLDDLSGDELKEIVEDIDNKGYSVHPFTPGYELIRNYDYRDFDIKSNNVQVRRYFSRIKKGYEVGE